MGQLFGSSKESEDKENKQVECKPLRRRRVSPLVLKRVSSMFFDEDGYLAHEFYEETRVCTDDRASTRGGVARGERGSGAGGKGGKTSTVRWTMKRVIKNLVPQGEVNLQFPRLHNDIPVVLLEQSTFNSHHPELSSYAYHHYSS